MCGEKTVKNKKLFVVIIIYLGLLLLNTSIGSAVPVLDKMDISPSKLAPQGTAAFTASVSDYDYVDAVYLIVDECTEGLCFTDGFNESMTHNGIGEFESEITLKHESATEIKYHVEIKVKNNPSVDWTTSDSVSYDLDVSGSSNGDTNNGNSSNNTPGFELLFVLSAIFIGLLLFRKKR